MVRKLIFLYLVFWGLWVAIGAALNYMELATYLGFDRWTVGKAYEKADVFNAANCEDKSSKIACHYWQPDPNSYVTEDEVEYFASMFYFTFIKAPLFLFLFLLALGWLIKAVFSGSRRKKSTKA